MKKILVFLCCAAFFLTGTSFASGGSSAADFLLLQYGSRSAALGGAFNARARGPEALFYNRAGLARGESNEVRAAYNLWLEETGYGYASFRFPAPFGGGGFGLRYFNAGSMTRRRFRDDDEGSYSMTSMAFDAAMGINFAPSTRGGFGITFFRESIDDESIPMAFAFSMGAQYDMVIEQENMDHHLQAGLSIDNIGPGIGYHIETFPLPLLARASIADTVFNGKLSGELGVEFMPVEEVLEVCLGVEFSPVDLLDLRLGYRVSDTEVAFPRGFSLGVGFIYAEEDMNYVFDYGFAPMAELGMGHRLGFGLRF